MNRVYVAFDFSLTGTGCIAIGDGRIIERKTIKTTPENTHAERIARIADEAVAFTMRHNPDALGIEDVASHGAFNIVPLAKIQGAFEYALRKAGCERPIYKPGPTTIKKFATGHGRGEKSDIKMFVFKKWGEELGDNNQADAYVAGRIAGAIHGGLPVTEKHEAECVKTVAGKKA